MKRQYDSNRMKDIAKKYRYLRHKFILTVEGKLNTENLTSMKSMEQEGYDK